MSYIERGKVRDMLHAEMDAYGNCADEIDALLKANEKLFEIPPADVAPVRKGRWETIGLSSLKCSECGYLDDMKMYHRYCPDCGCFMR